MLRQIRTRERTVSRSPISNHKSALAIRSFDINQRTKLVIRVCSIDRDVLFVHLSLHFHVVIAHISMCLSKLTEQHELLLGSDTRLGCIIPGQTFRMPLDLHRGLIRRISLSLLGLVHHGILLLLLDHLIAEDVD